MTRILSIKGWRMVGEFEGSGKTYWARIDAYDKTMTDYFLVCS